MTLQGLDVTGCTSCCPSIRLQFLTQPTPQDVAEVQPFNHQFANPHFPEPFRLRPLPFGLLRLPAPSPSSTMLIFVLSTRLVLEPMAASLCLCIINALQSGAPAFLRRKALLSPLHAEGSGSETEAATDASVEDETLRRL